jgi:hypothetical protein
MLEVECAFTDSLEQICILVEELIRFFVSKMDPASQNGDFETSLPFCQLNSNENEESASFQVSLIIFKNQMSANC